MKCRACKAPVTDLVLSLGKSPLANAFVEPSAEAASEPFFPLEVYVCRSCWLMQLGVFETPENIFGDYAYFSSFSDT